MRTLDEITAAVRRGEDVATEELKCCIAAYDVLLYDFKVENHPILLAKFFAAAEMDVQKYIGWANDPTNPECNAWHKAFIGVENNGNNEPET